MSKIHEDIKRQDDEVMRRSERAIKILRRLYEPPAVSAVEREKLLLEATRVLGGSPEAIKESVTAAFDRPKPKREESCGECQGSGLRPGWTHIPVTQPKHCLVCGGSGKAMRPVTPAGQVQVLQDARQQALDQAHEYRELLERCREGIRKKWNWDHAGWRLLGKEIDAKVGTP